MDVHLKWGPESARLLCVLLVLLLVLLKMRLVILVLGLVLGLLVVGLEGRLGHKMEKGVRSVSLGDALGASREKVGEESVEERGDVSSRPFFDSSSSPGSSPSSGKKKRQEKTMPQPELTNSRVLPMEAYIMNERYEYIVTSLDFDQDLYLNEPFVCAGQDIPCVNSTCVPCDWTGENRTGCLDDKCCGPSQWPDLAAFTRREEWCDDSQPPFTKLNFGEISEKFEATKNEHVYFRFFVSEENFCKPISITVHTDYGQSQLLVHNLIASPSYDVFLQYNTEYFQNYLGGRLERENGLFNYGQSVIDICPNVNPTYSPGTYAIGVKSLSAYTRFAIELRYGEDEYPLLPPEDRINCSSVPPEELNTQVLGDVDLYGDHICLEEGVTTSYFFESSDNSKFFEIIMPVLPGCQEIQFAYNGFTGQGVTASDSDNDFYCFQTSESRTINTAYLGRSRTFDDTFYIAGCFDEITYLHCTSQSFSGSFSTGMFYWTSRATPRRYKMTELSPGMMAMVTGVSHAGALAPGLAYDTFLSWGFTGVSYLAQPSEDPVVFWPPVEPFVYNFTGTPSEVYEKEVVREGLKANKLVIVDITTKKNQEVRNRDQLLKNGFIVVSGITNIEGTPVKLKNNGRPLSNRSITDWVPHQTFESLNVMRDFSSLCDGAKYYRELGIVDQLTKAAVESSNLETISGETFLNNIFNAGLARSACIQAVERSMEEVTQTFPRVEINYCDFEFESEEWYQDPCCNEPLQAWQCCAPQTVTDAVDLYVGADEEEIEKICGNSACAASYYSDISKSLNSRGNPLLGCSSGIRDPIFELTVRIERELERFVRPCLEQAGFGRDFLGVKCLTDDDCKNIGYGCSSRGRCYLGSTEEAQNRYFDCYLNEMSAPVEEYIRQQVVNPVYSWLPLDSPTVQREIRAGATINNCLDPNNPLDLSQSERWEADSLIWCKSAIGFDINFQVDEINAACPPRLCLGEETCRYVNVTDCYQTQDSCSAFYHSYMVPTEAECSTNVTECNVQGGNCTGLVCVGCEGEEGGCEEVEGVGEEDCGVEGGRVLCVTAEGEWRFDLTEEECVGGEGEEGLPGKCDTDCRGDRCISGQGLGEFCVFTSVNNSDDCWAGDWLALGGTENDGFCWADFILDEEACQSASAIFGMPTHWTTCNDLTIDECQVDQSFTQAVYYYLYCTIDSFRPCETEKECLASGRCSDEEETKDQYFNNTNLRYYFQYGGCFASGVKGITNEKEPFCYWPEDENENNYACRYNLAVVWNEELCAALNTTGENDVWRRTRWIYPAKTKETCLDRGFGRYGCVLPGTIDIRPYFWLEDECACKQGQSEYVFEWTEPTWRTPKAYPLQWKEKSSREKYQWGESLSLITMENWVIKAIEELFVLEFKSQIVCENNYLTSSLSTLVCDCYGGNQELNDNNDCYSGASLETRVGLSGACQNETSILKGPPSFTTFNPDSMEERCSEVYLDLIQQSWFSFPPSVTGVSFQFAERQQKGTVLNQNDATVGELMGDGSKLTFRFPDRLNYFRICLLVQGQNRTTNSDYVIPDFGSPNSDFTFIRPLGVKEITEEMEESLVYWCAGIERDQLKQEGSGNRESITLFPVLVMEGWEGEEEEGLSDRTEALVYTLGAGYCLDLIFLLLYVAVIIKTYVMVGRSVPLVMWIGVIFSIVCIFRIVFCFVYTGGGFEEEELSEYVVFEIPTFLLFTAVILAIALFMRLSKKSTFDFRGTDRKLWIIGMIAVSCVWSLFVVVTVVYSEVILEAVDENACPGRIEDDNSKQEEDTRTLSIIYQSIVIFLTLIFGLMFLHSAVTLFTMTKRGPSHAKRFIFRIGSVIVASFFLRCILFLILLAIDITSDIYLFITLMLTEVVMMMLVALEFNQRFYNKLATNAFSSVFSDNSGSGGTGTGATTVSVDQTNRTVMDD